MMSPSITVNALRSKAQDFFPGILIAVMVGITAQFLSEHYDTPAMLLALLLGIALSFLGEEGKTVPGIAFSARSLLRLGIAFLGVRISVESTLALGPALIGMVVGSVLLTIGFGLLIARFFGHGWRFAFLTAGSVAICGASAALAISAILPKDDRSEQRLIFTVMGVTVLSTIAMIAYPIFVQQFDMSPKAQGVFLGGTIHDVAQVVGAGFSISEQTGDTATLVKLIRVSMLAPVVIVASILIRSFAEAPIDGKRPPILPSFVLAFLVLAGLNSFHLIPEPIAALMSQTSRWLLLTAIAAVGMKTNLKQVLAVGGAAIALLFVETLFIAGLIMAGIAAIT